MSPESRVLMLCFLPSSMCSNTCVAAKMSARRTAFHFGCGPAGLDTASGYSPPMKAVYLQCGDHDKDEMNALDSRRDALPVREHKSNAVHFWETQEEGESLLLAFARNRSFDCLLLLIIELINPGSCSFYLKGESTL